MKNTNEAGKKLRPLQMVGRAMGFTADAATSVVGTVFKAIGTVLLILMVAGLLFACIFAYYIKNSRQLSAGRKADK